MKHPSTLHAKLLALIYRKTRIIANKLFPATSVKLAESYQNHPFWTSAQAI